MIVILYFIGAALIAAGLVMACRIIHARQVERDRVYTASRRRFMMASQVVYGLVPTHPRRIIPIIYKKTK